MTYRMLVRARHIKDWRMYDAGLVDAVPKTINEAMTMIPASDMQEVDCFYFIEVSSDGSH